MLCGIEIPQPYNITVMKKSFFLFSAMFSFFCFLMIGNTDAQVWKKIKNEVKSRTENKIVNKIGNATDKAIDKTIDGDKTAQESGSQDASTEKSADVAMKSSKPGVTSYKNYDFVQGDKIIFEPDLSKEADAELPARFKIIKGNAEIQSFEGDKILHLQAEGDATVAPLMNSEDYLPEQFTVEFDMMYENDADYFKYVNDFAVEFRKPEETNYNIDALYRFLIENNSRVVLGPRSASEQNLTGDIAKSVQTGNIWHHIAIYVRKNIGKAYIDQYRVFATNTLPTGAGKLDIRSERYGAKIKNVRIAAGGDDKYNKIVTDGKFVTHGILFDVNKAVIKPESMGALNEIAKILKDHPDLKFEIDGHTDSDGKADLNVKLSQDRADAVKSKLVEMGIDESRLTTKGFGASKPIDKNDSAEGKANNRRVEFVKI
jgi:outer membrane protein OmpA-like peptidoglycan-associated protein